MNIYFEEHSFLIASILCEKDKNFEFGLHEDRTLKINNIEHPELF